MGRPPRTSSMHGSWLSNSGDLNQFKPGPEALFTSPKTMENDLQTLKNRGPEGPKPSLKTLQITPEMSKSVQELSERCPRGARGWPRASQSRPSGSQEPSKRGSGPSKTQPCEPQDEFLAQSVLTALFDSLQVRNLVVFGTARGTADMRFVLVFPIQNASQACLALHVCMLEKTFKNRSPELPKPFRNRARRVLERPKIGPERRRTQQKTQNAPTKRPRAQNSANMVPTRSQQGLTKFRSVESVARLAPPKAC